MTYREKLAKIIDMEADRLLAIAQSKDEAGEPRKVSLEQLERLCRCAKILGDDETPESGDEPDEADLLSMAGVTPAITG